MATHIAICIITYHREKGLLDLLNGIEAINVPHNVHLEVFIIDNDKRGSAKKVFSAHEKKSKFAITYAVEDNQGIPFARNKALELTLDKFDYITFIDDDEIPSQEWITELLEAKTRYQADAVMGPALPLFAPNTPVWIEKGKFFEKRQFTEGQVLSSGSTCNVLVRTAAIRQYGLKFEESMAMTGGTDALFFSVMSEKGGKIVWADRAIVYEQIPGSRANAKWILKRAYRFGNSLALQDLKTGYSVLKVCKRICKGLGYITWGGLRLLVTFPLGKIYIIKSGQSILRGLGNIMGLLNIRYNEYRTIHRI
jgi:glycosyltransferase involved in cell wall biosynthesis